MRSGSFKQSSLIGLGLLILYVLLVPNVSNGLAANFSQAATTTPQPSGSTLFEGNIVGNNVCLSCHGQPGLTKNLVHGDMLDLYVSPEEYSASIHGSQGYACVQCHTSYQEIPHPVRNFADLRDVTISLTTETCARCHTGEAENVQNSVHAIAQAAGQREAAVCSDCHSPHATRRLTDSTGELTAQARLYIPQTCAQCHYAIYETYRTSVHGEALFEENNPDVPTCTDCHGVHNIPNPTTAAFRLASPELCASCHTDPAVMDKYGISTQVLSTYVADFHGTTVTLFEHQTPDAETNKPVCFDCHGVHNIVSVSDPEKGLRVKENLLARCQVCHPDATENFPSAWLSHFIPDPQKTPLVYYVTLFYKVFIPGVLGGMAILVALDLRKLLSQRLKNRRKLLAPVTEDNVSDSKLSEFSEQIESPSSSSEVSLTTPDVQGETGEEVIEPSDAENQEPTLPAETVTDPGISSESEEEKKPGGSVIDEIKPTPQVENNDSEVTHE